MFGVQGLNGYPLEPWDKVTGEIYPESVEYWREMDLSNYGEQVDVQVPSASNTVDMTKLGG